MITAPTKWATTTVPSNAALSFVNSSIYRQAVVMSFWGDVGGRGGGIFWADYADTVSKDNGGSIRRGLDGTCWKQSKDAVVRLSGFGARFSPLYSDRTPLQNALNFVRDSGGGAVIIDRVLGSAAYLDAGVVGSSGVTVVAENPHAYRGYGSILKALHGFAGTMLSFPSGTENCGAVGIVFQGIGDGSTTPCVGVSLAGHDGEVTNCGFSMFNDQGILIGYPGTTETISNSIEDNVLTSCVQNRVRDRIVGALEAWGTDHYLIHNQAGCGYSGYKTPFPAPVDPVNKWVTGIALLGANFFVTASSGENSDVGIRSAIGTGAHRIANCRGDFNSCDGWLIENGQNQIVNAFAQNNSQSADGVYDGMVLGPAAYGNGVNLTCKESLPKGARYGVNDLVNGNGNGQRNTIEVRGSGWRKAPANTQPFSGSTPFEPTVRVRVPDGCATPDTTGTSLIDFTAYTLTTRIANFDGGQGNKVLHVLGSSKVTIVNTPSGAGIRTSTGADKTLEDGRWYQYLLVNNVWIER